MFLKPYGTTLRTTLTTLFNHTKNNTKKSLMGALKNRMLFINISLEIITNLYKIKQDRICYNSYAICQMIMLFKSKGTKFFKYGNSGLPWWLSG